MTPTTTANMPGAGLGSIAPLPRLETSGTAVARRTPPVRRRHGACLPSVWVERVTLAAFHPVDATGGGRNLSDHSVNLGEQGLRDRDLGHPERDSARVADDLCADLGPKQPVGLGLLTY